jgi:phosphopantothenoylcysteine decarboxylase/phosphopantothenate--cysteine ligase
VKPLEGREVVLGVTGGIAAYKAVELARRLITAGAGVTAVMTENATRFLGPLTLETVTGREVIQGMFALRRHDVAHIALSDRAELVVVAPATANLMGKLAAGIADDFLTTFLLSCDCPLLLAPAMNTRMWSHPAVQANRRLLAERGVHFIGPESGELACGAEGPGRLAAPAQIAARAADLLLAGPSLEGLTVLITAGPTREYLDPARFLSNPSSGRMGDALAGGAHARGARVILVRGPCPDEPPLGVEVVPVVSAREMHDAVLQHAAEADIAILAAAVADFRPRERHDAKLKKQDLGESPILELERNPDILRELGALPDRPFLVGFAAETDDLEANARRKLEAKGADMIVANRIGVDHSGFGAATTEALILSHGAPATPLPLMDKQQAAHRILDAVLDAYWRGQE